MRNLIEIVESIQNTPVTTEELTHAIKTTTEKYIKSGIVTSAYEIGNGHCYDFTREICELLNIPYGNYAGARGVREVRTEDFWKEEWTIDPRLLKKAGEKIPKDIPIHDFCNLIGSATHEWLYCNSKHFDAMCPEGVTRILDMPFFKDQLEGYRDEMRNTK